MRTKGRPTAKIEKKLITLQKGECALCHSKLYFYRDNSSPIFIGELAHICAASPNGPRFDSRLNEVHNIENLLFLCPNCHKLVDDNDNKNNFNVSYLKSLSPINKEK